MLVINVEGTPYVIVGDDRYSFKLFKFSGIKRDPDKFVSELREKNSLTEVLKGMQTRPNTTYYPNLYYCLNAIRRDRATIKREGVPETLEQLQSRLKAIDNDFIQMLESYGFSSTNSGGTDNARLPS